ncbi:MAG: hypothetical protein HOQ45_14585, partial [Nocardioidaceae bacterium]|nr:hypothetical protein [Nocardioidaceae bacterium]
AEASGDAAAGLFGFRSDASGSTLGLTACPEPRAQWWFTGGGAGLDHASTLDLVNVDPGPAVFDITVLGPDGPVETVGTKGITLQPDSRKSIPLSDIAPQTDELALEVHASRGRVVATVDDRYAAKAGAAQGQEWLSGTDRPSRVVRLSGVPTKGDRTLEVANPGDLEAVVDVKVAGRGGTFTPTGLQPLTVSPGSVQTVDLTTSLPGKEAVALRVTSRTPVLASMRTSTRSDHAYAGPVLPLAGPAAAPFPAGVPSTVQLTAGATGGRARMTAYAARGRKLDGTTLRVPPNGTLSWSPSANATRAGGYLVVAPSAGTKVSGAVSYEDGTDVATVPLTELPIRVERPAVRPGVR